jgi:hypothetical protein
MSTDGCSVATTIQQRKSKDACEVINIGDEIQFFFAPSGEICPAQRPLTQQSC